MKLSKQALIALGIASAGVMGCSNDEQLTREQIDQMLKDLVAKPVQEPTMGAMCYEMGSPPERIDYRCPVCKTKTYHAKDDVWFVQRVNEYRQAMKRIKKLGLDATLDETDLCSQCRKDKATETVDFYIVVTLDKRSIRTRLEYADELDKIIAFLEKKDMWTSDNEGKYPLQPELPRIRKILGMDEEAK